MSRSIPSAFGALAVLLTAGCVAPGASLGPADPPAPAVASDAALNAGEVAEAQTLLRSLGYSVGVADGIVGPRTRTAIRGYQASTGAAVNGVPTQGLLASLRGSAAALPEPGGRRRAAPQRAREPARRIDRGAAGERVVAPGRAGAGGLDAPGRAERAEPDRRARPRGPVREPAGRP